MTKTKKLSRRLGVLLLAVLVVLGGFAVTRASAEGEAGSFVGYRNVGQEWQGKYGKDGYLVFSGTPDGGTTTSGEYDDTDQIGAEYTEAL